MSKKGINKNTIFIVCMLILSVAICIFAAAMTFKNKIIIKNPTFDKQISEIYENKEDYLGKTIEMQGYYQVIQNGDENYHFVIQYIPYFDYDSAEDSKMTGYYKLDGRGIEIYSASGIYPVENEWCTVTGVLEEFTDENTQEQYIRINLTDVKRTYKPDDILDKIYNFDPGETIDLGIQEAPSTPDPISEIGQLSSEEDLLTHNH